MSRKHNAPDDDEDDDDRRRRRESNNRVYNDVTCVAAVRFVPEFGPVRFPGGRWGGRLRGGCPRSCFSRVRFFFPVSPVLTTSGRPLVTRHDAINIGRLVAMLLARLKTETGGKKKKKQFLQTRTDPNWKQIFPTDPGVDWAIIVSKYLFRSIKIDSSLWSPIPDR